MTFSPIYKVLMHDKIESKLIDEMPKVPERYRDYESPTAQDLSGDIMPNFTDFRKMNEFWKMQVLIFNNLNFDGK